jgi:hypothetical protein
MIRQENKNISQKSWMIVSIQPKSIIYPKIEKRNYFELLQTIGGYEMWRLYKKYDFPFPHPQIWFTIMQAKDFSLTNQVYQ